MAGNKKKKNARAAAQKQQQQQTSAKEEEHVAEAEETEAAAAAATTATTEEEKPAEVEKDEADEDDGVDSKYPLSVVYCPVCGLPPEFCEFGPTPAKCFAEHPELHEGQEPPAPSAKEAAAAQKQQETAEAAEGKPAAEGAAAEAAPAAAAPSKSKKGKKEVVMTVTQRNKRKCITSIAGMDLFDVKLPEISKMFSKRFACGSTVTKNASNVSVVEVQGDVAAEVAEILAEKYNVPEEAMFVVRGKEKTRILS